MQLEQDGDDDERDFRQDIGNPFHHQVRCAAVIAFDRTVDGSDKEVDCRHADRQQEGKACTGGKPCKDILSPGVRPENKTRFKSVTVLEIGILVDPGDIALGRTGSCDPGIGHRVFGIVVRGNPQAVVGCILRGGGPVDALEVSLLVQLGLALLVHFVPDIGVGLLGVLDGRINHLNPVLILPFLDIFKLIPGQGQVQHAHGCIVVDPEIVECGFSAGRRVLVIGAVGCPDCFQAGFLRDRLIVMVFPAVYRHVAASVDAQERNLRGQLCVIQVHGIRQGPRIGRFAEDRDQDGIQHQKKDNPGSRHGSLVLPEPVHGVPEIANRFGFQFFVMCPAFHGYKTEFILRYLEGGGIHHLLTHTFLLPILILGSMNP